MEDEKVVTSQIAYLRMQLEEKRRHIEAEKYRAQAEWEDQRRRLGQTAFWYVIGKAQGSKNVGEGTGSEVRKFGCVCWLICFFVILFFKCPNPSHFVKKTVVLIALEKQLESDTKG